MEITDITSTDATFSVPIACSYYVTVSAQNSAGEGTKANEYLISDGTAPGTPTSLGATPLDNRIDLSWTAPTTDNYDIAGYRIYRATTSPPTGGLLDTTDDLGTIYQDVGLSNCTTYFYMVQAIDDCGNASGYSNIVSATTGSSPPRNPTDLVHVPPFIPGQASLSWTAPPNNVDGTDFVYGDPAYYNVYRGPSPSGPWTLLSSSYYTTYTDYTCGSCSYMVRAVDICGNESADSNVAAPLSLTVDFQPGYPYKSSGQRKVRVEVSVVDQNSIPVTDATVTVTVTATGYTDETDTLVHNGDGVYGCGSHPKWYWEGTTGYGSTDEVTVTVTAEKTDYLAGTTSLSFE